MGERGPAPKRESQRRRQNKPDRPITKSVAAGRVVVPVPNGKWHPVAKSWFVSLGESGQSRFYEPSDWALASLVAESMSRDLRPKVVGVSGDGRPVKASAPISGASMSAYLKAMSDLLVSEAGRRRASIELERPGDGDGDGERADVPELDDYRNRLRSG